MANFRIEIDKTAAGNYRVRHQDKNGKMATDYVIKKDERLQVDGAWLTAKSIAGLFKDKLMRQYMLKEIGHYDPDALVEPLCGTFLNECEANNLSPNTLKLYEVSLRHLREQAKITTIGDLTNDRLKEWRDKMIAANLANSTIRTRLIGVAVFVNWLKENGKIGASPLGRKLVPAKKEKTPRFYTPEEFIALDSSLVKVDPYARLACNFAHSAGLRLVELVGDGFGREGIRWDDIRWLADGRADLILRKEVVKGQRKGRSVRLDEGLVSLLGSRSTGPIIRRTRWQLVEDFQKARKLAGINPKLTFHGLRHTFAKNYLQRGGSLRGLMELLGHTDISTTQIYSNLEASFLADSIERAYLWRKKEEAMLNLGNIPLEIEGQMRGNLLKNDEPQNTDMDQSAQQQKVKTASKNMKNTIDEA